MNDCLKEPALYVGDIDDDIDLNLPATSGEEYIKQVVIEAKRCESVVVAEIDESRLKRPTVNVKQPEIENRRGWIDLCSAEVHGESRFCPPTLSTVLSISNPMVEQVLEYLVEFIETEEKLPSELGQWIYALLAVLEQPLNPDACSCLRTLARTCSIIRANMVHIFLKVM